MGDPEVVHRVGDEGDEPPHAGEGEGEGEQERAGGHDGVGPAAGHRGGDQREEEGGDERAQCVLQRAVIAEPTQEALRELRATELDDDEDHRGHEPGEGDHATAERGHGGAGARRAEAEEGGDRVLLVPVHERDAEDDGEDHVPGGNDPDRARHAVPGAAPAPAAEVDHRIGRLDSAATDAGRLSPKSAIWSFTVSSYVMVAEANDPVSMRRSVTHFTMNSPVVVHPWRVTTVVPIQRTIAVEAFASDHRSCRHRGRRGGADDRIHRYRRLSEEDRR